MPPRNKAADAAETATPVAEAPTLAAKLLAVAQVITHVEKGGRNTHQNYDYVQAADVLATVRRELHSRNVIVLPGTVPGSVQHFTETGGKGFVTTVDLHYRFIDTDTREELVLPWTGAGADVGGDKGLYKAYTGGLKYALLGAFLIPTGDDPEGDSMTSGGGGYDSKAADADRPAATRIPVDRAKAIADAAVAAELAAWGEDGAFMPTAVFKAKLADLGVDKVGQLDVDMAEALEAFVAAEGARS